MSLKRIARRRFLASAGAVLTYTAHKSAQAAPPQGTPAHPTHPMVPPPSIAPVPVADLSPDTALKSALPPGLTGKDKLPPPFANLDFDRNPFLRAVGPVYSKSEGHGPPHKDRTFPGLNDTN